MGCCWIVQATFDMTKLVLSEVTENRLRRAFELAYDWSPDSSNPGLVFIALQNMLDIMYRMPHDSAGTRSLLKSLQSCWPAFQMSDEERLKLWQDLCFMVVDRGVVTFDLEEDTKANPDPSEVAMMEDVLSVFRKCCYGDAETIGRDWQLMCLQARGRTPKDAAKQVGGVSAKKALERKDMQCQYISHRLVQYIP